MRFHDSPWLLLRNSPEPSIVGHGLSTAETVLPQVANMAAATLQLGRGLSTAETYSRSAVKVKQLRFNWAAVFQPRKLDAKIAKHRIIPASIGPRSFNRGNWLAGLPRRSRRLASIGPRSFNLSLIHISEPTRLGM